MSGTWSFSSHMIPEYTPFVPLAMLSCVQIFSSNTHSAPLTKYLFSKINCSVSWNSEKSIGLYTFRPPTLFFLTLHVQFRMGSLLTSPNLCAWNWIIFLRSRLPVVAIVANLHFSSILISSLVIACSFRNHESVIGFLFSTSRRALRSCFSYSVFALRWPLRLNSWNFAKRFTPAVYA